MVHSEGVDAPKYEYARKNIWPAYLAKPKRQPKDVVPTCNCWPSQPSSQGHRLLTTPRQAGMHLNPAQQNSNLYKPLPYY